MAACSSVARPCYASPPYPYGLNGSSIAANVKRSCPAEIACRLCRIKSDFRAKHHRAQCRFIASADHRSITKE